jgi:hypothetical protein
MKTWFAPPRAKRIGVFILATWIWFAISLGAAQFASLNLDEPWYLTASNRVFNGFLLYRDFAYTQGPILPYFYGIFTSVLGADLWSGRFVSVWLSTLSWVLVSALAHRMGGILALVLAWSSILHTGTNCAFLNV